MFRAQIRWFGVIAVVTLLAATATAALAAGHVYFGGDVAGYYRQRPSFIHVTSDQNIKRIRWASWGEKTASGRGTLFFSVADRLPPASLKLKLENIHKCGKRLLYLRVVVTYIAGVPPGEKSSYFIDFTCRSPFA